MYNRSDQSLVQGRIHERRSLANHSQFVAIITSTGNMSPSCSEWVMMVVLFVVVVVVVVVVWHVLW
jgi:t-SNARE complex subunit (syntaxin)